MNVCFGRSWPVLLLALLTQAVLTAGCGDSFQQDISGGSGGSTTGTALLSVEFGAGVVPGINGKFNLENVDIFLLETVDYEMFDVATQSSERKGRLTVTEAMKLARGTEISVPGLRPGQKIAFVTLRLSDGKVFWEQFNGITVSANQIVRASDQDINPVQGEPPSSPFTSSTNGTGTGGSTNGTGTGGGTAVGGTNGGNVGGTNGGTVGGTGGGTVGGTNGGTVGGTDGGTVGGTDGGTVGGTGGIVDNSIQRLGTTEAISERALSEDGTYIFHQFEGQPQLIDRLGTRQSFDITVAGGLRISSDGNLLSIPSTQVDPRDQGMGFSNSNVWIYDLAADLYRQADLNENGRDEDPNGVLNGIGAHEGYISGDGNFVAFRLRANEFSPGVLDGFSRVNVYLKNFAAGPTGTVNLCSTSLDQFRPDAGGGETSISHDGRFVAYTSHASNLVPDDTNFASDAFVYDRQTGSVSRVSVSSTGQQGTESVTQAAISGDGRFVVFVSRDSLLADDVPANSVNSIFIHDLASRETRFVASLGTNGISSTGRVAISTNGQYIAFDRASFELNEDFQRQAFVIDSQSGESVRVSQSATGSPDDSGANVASLSGDGRFVVFTSGATNLTADSNPTSMGLFLVRNVLLP